ncbi:hypothetical protein [Paraburkholderia bannensis]|uniref:hypothetical protein n=1 Tax=Paraburkholderia bannensis TaxID=765414 RepID=UPI002AB2456F|nr:hypothetical protein [Paraburkholderia bannensis]
MSTPAAWTLHAGAAFLAPSGPGNYQHLFVVLNDPMPFPQKGSQDCVCVVNFSTPPKSIPYDTTCVFLANSHPFIQHDSYVYYARAQELFANDVATHIANGTYKAFPPDFSLAQLQLLKDGLQKSPKTPKHIKSLPI